jgi:hypothetical protein
MKIIEESLSTIKDLKYSLFLWIYEELHSTDDGNKNPAVHDIKPTCKICHSLNRTNKSQKHNQWPQINDQAVTNQDIKTHLMPTNG